MTDAHQLARVAAKRLGPKFGEDLPLAVEKVIHGGAGKPSQFVIVEVASVAMFIVQCAQFAHDWRKSKRLAEKSDIEALKRELRLELGRPEHVTEKVRDDVIDVVAEEVKEEK